MVVPFSSRHPALRWLYTAFWLAVVIAGLAAGSNLGARTSDRWKPPAGSESATNYEQIYASSAGNNGISAIIYGDPNDPQVQAATKDAADDVRKLDGVSVVLDYPTTKLDLLKAADGESTTILAFLKPGPLDQVRSVAALTEQRLNWVPGSKRVVVSNETFYDDVVSAFVANDNQVSQPATISVLLLVLLLSFWGFRRALLFIPVGVCALCISWVLIWVAAGQTQVPRLPTQVLGTLALVLAAFEWRLLLSVYPSKIHWRVAVAGGAAIVVPALAAWVLTQDVTVKALSLCVAVAGVSVTVVTLSLIPVWLQWCRPLLDSIPVRRPLRMKSDMWRILASGVCVIVLAVAAIGMLGIKFRPTSPEDLPAGTPVREVVSELLKNYPTIPVVTTTILAETTPTDPAVQEFVNRLLATPGVSKVQIRPLLSPDAAGVALVDVRADPNTDPIDLGFRIRQTPAPFAFTVGGTTGSIADRYTASRYTALACLVGALVLTAAAGWVSRSGKRAVTMGAAGVAVLAVTAGTAGWIFASGRDSLISDYGGSGRLDWYTPFYATALVWPIVAILFVHTAAYPRRLVVPEAWLAAGMSLVYLMGVWSTGRVTKEWAVTAAAGCLAAAAVSWLVADGSEPKADEDEEEDETGVENGADLPLPPPQPAFVPSSGMPIRF